MKRFYFSLATFLLFALPSWGQTSLFLEEFTETPGGLSIGHVQTPVAAGRALWAIAGDDNPNQIGGALLFNSDNTNSWISEAIDVAGYSSLNLTVDAVEAGNFNGADSLMVYVIEDGVQRLLSSQVANDFEVLTLSESCTASVSLQVLVLLTCDNASHVRLDKIEVTGTSSFVDIDADGTDDSLDSCIDMDADGTCDQADTTIMLMDEDFASHAVGTGLAGKVLGSPDERGIALVEGASAAGEPGWVLTGHSQKNAVVIRSSGGEKHIEFNRTGYGSDDTDEINWVSKEFNLAHILDPKVRFVLGEESDFSKSDPEGEFEVTFIEDDTERLVMTLNGEFTSVDTTLTTSAKQSLTVVLRTYAQADAVLKLEHVSMFGGFCQTGKDAEGDCQDIGCTDPRACSYNSMAIVNDVTKCNYIGDACDDGDASNYVDRYVNAGDGTCNCEGFALQTVYNEDFSQSGEAQGGLNYGYEGSSDISDSPSNTNNSSLETEWTLSFEDSNVGSGTGLSPSPFYFATEVPASMADTVMTAMNTNGNYMRWTSRSIHVGGFDSVYVSGSLMGIFGAHSAADYIQMGWEDNAVLQSPLLQQITGVSSAEATFNEKLSVSSGNLSIRVEVKNNIAGSNTASAYGFDDVLVTGLKRGCTDPDASNYEAAPSDGFIALSDDGTCEYDWSKAYSRKDGEFGDAIWAGKPCSAAGYTCGSASMYIDAHALTENGTRHAVISANSKITVPSNGYSIGELTLEAGAELLIMEGGVLTVNGDVHLEGGTISGTGRLLVKGKMELASDLTSVEVHDFTFGEGAELALENGDTLRVKGDLTIDDGSAIAGRIELSGSTAQVVSGADVHFDTLHIASAGVDFAADVQIDGVLKIAQGVVDMEGHALTFGSSASGTGMLDMISTGASLEDNHTGTLQAVDATSERYIGPDSDGVTYTGYTLFTSPMTGVTVGDLNGISGFYLAGFPGTAWPNSFSSILFWDEVKAEFIEPASLNTPLDTLGGAWIVLAGSQSPTMSSAGKLRSHAEGSSKTFALTRTTGTSYAGWNLVQNPYQAPISWTAILAASTNVQDQYAVYDTQIQAFVRRSADGTFTTADDLIMPGQAFWVAVDAAQSSGSLVVPASAIVVSGDLPAFIRNEGDDLWEATLGLEIENDYGVQTAVVKFGPWGSEQAVEGVDLSHLSSSSVNAAQLAVESESDRFIKKGLPMMGTSSLFVKSKAGMATTLRVSSFSDEAEVCVTITDTETGEVMVSRVGDQMTFTLPSDQAEEGRFMLEVIPSAVVQARTPSCPEIEDGRVEVGISEGSANVLLTDEEHEVLAQVLGATGSAVFENLAPGTYGLVVAGPELRCGTERRHFVVEPGVQPELLGLDWNVPACNAGVAELEFEIYGSGDFNTSLRQGNQEVWSDVEHGGEVELTGLEPGTYALEIEHLCFEETVVVDLYDVHTVTADADYSPMIVMDPVGGTALEAFSMCTGEEEFRWLVDGEVVGENEPLFYPVDLAGGHVVELEAWNALCSDVVELPFLVVNWNEARLMEAPVVVREEGQHWALVFGEDLGWTQLELTDAAGRTVWSETLQVEAGHVQRVERPMTAGTYLMRVSGDAGQWGFPVLSAGF